MAGLGGMYIKCMQNPGYNLLADSGFSAVDGLIRTTNKFLEDIDDEYNNEYGSAKSINFVQCRQAAGTSYIKDKIH